MSYQYMQVASFKPINQKTLISSFFAKNLVDYIVSLFKRIKHLLIVPYTNSWKMSACNSVVMVVDVLNLLHVVDLGSMIAKGVEFLKSI